MMKSLAIVDKLMHLEEVLMGFCESIISTDFIKRVKGSLGHPRSGHFSPFLNTDFFLKFILFGGGGVGDTIIDNHFLTLRYTV